MTTRQAIWGMHFVALAWGSSAVFGAMISAPSQVIVLGRCITAVLTLLIIFGKKPIKDYLSLKTKSKLLIILNGILLGTHWILFFLSIKSGGVALGLVTFATAGAQISIGEVLFLKAKFRPAILIASLLSVLGVYVIHPVENLGHFLDPGLVYGIGAAFLISVLALVGKYLLTDGLNPITYSFVQLIFATLVSIPFAFATGIGRISLTDLVYIMILGAICSAMGQCIFNSCVRQVRISTGAVISIMEVPYGVLLAALVLHQTITLKVALGMIFVTAGAVMVSIGQEKKLLKLSAGNFSGFRQQL